VSGETGPSRIGLDVSVAGENVILGLDHAGAKTPLPQRADALVVSIHILRVQLADMLHQAGAAVFQFTGEQQMDVIRHQAVRVQSAARRLKPSAEMEQKETTVLVLKEARLAIVSPLHDVRGYSRKDDARSPRHVRSTGFADRR
jgi:hypothetical protein